MNYVARLMPSQAVSTGCDMIARHYPTFAPANTTQLHGLIDDYVRAVPWADGDTILAGFRLALEGAGKFKPAFGEVVAAIKDADKRRNAHLYAEEVQREWVICAACGAETLVELRHRTNADAPTRLFPRHADHCPVRLPNAMEAA